MTHDAQREVDIGARDDVAREMKLQSPAHCGPHHEQGGDILRADVAGHIYATAEEPPAIDAERRETFLVLISYVSAQLPQRFHQHADGAVPHALGARDGMGAGRDGEIGRHEAHGRARRHDVDYLWGVL